MKCKFTTLLFIFCWLVTIPLLAQNIHAPYVPNEVLVKFKNSTSPENANAIRQEIFGLNARNLGRTKIEHWKLPSFILINNNSFGDIEAVIQHYSTHPDIEFIEPNYLLSIGLASDDPSLNQLWGLDNQGQTGGVTDADIDALEAWDIIKESPNVKIGVLDTGIDWGHPDLVDNIWQNTGEDIDNDGYTIQWNGTAWEFDPDDIDGIDNDGNGYADDFVGWDFANNDNDPYDDHSHGTHVAGTIGAEGNNAEGISGVTWKVQMAALKFLSGNGGGSTSNAILAIDYATSMGFQITNNSWGGGTYSSALYQAISRANDGGQLFVAAAGNFGDDNDDFPMYPASYDLPNIISVAATNHEDNLAYFSNYGAVTVDLAAPGQSIYSCIPGNSYSSYSGTSMAAPHVAGAAALIWENCNALTHLEVKDRLLDNVDVIPATQGICTSNGRLNLYNTLEVDNGSANFTFTVSGLTVTFTPDYTGGSSYYWEFGDGGTSTEQMPTYTYPAAGSYMACLWVMNDCATYYHYEIVTLSIPCTASFSMESSNISNDNSICQGDIGTFTNTTPNIISSEWKVNNIVVSTANQFDYIFDELGPQIVTLYTDTNDGQCSISEEVFVYNTVRNLYLGEDIYVCEPSITLHSELPGMAAYFWDFNGAPIPISEGGGTPDLVVTESGTYRLSVFDHCDNFATDEIEVSLEACNDVWPGDVNYDGIVNYEDLLSLNYKYTDAISTTGPARLDPSSDWIAQQADDWGTNDPDGPDCKHVDCDGGGEIDPNLDSPIVSLNYGKTHPMGLSAPPIVLNQDYVLYGEESEIIISNEGTTHVFDLKLKNITNQPIDYQTIGCSIRYRRGANAMIDASESEMGDDGVNLHTFVQSISNRRIDMAIGRIDGANVTLPPNGEILVAKFISDANIVTGLPGNNNLNNVTLSLRKVVFMDNQGNKTYLGGSSASSNSTNQSNPSINSTNQTSLNVAMTAMELLDCSIGSTVTALPADGVEPYSYLWEDGQTTSSITYNQPGKYTVTITDAINEQIEGIIFVEGTINCNVLPLELLKFEAIPQQNNIALEWTTENEIAIEKFELQRSIDGIHFTTLGASPSKGQSTTTQKYQWIDETVNFNTLYYYRIKIIESSHKSTFSSIESAYLVKEIATTISLQPNPTSDKVTLFIQDASTAPMTISIYNQLGQQVFVATYPVSQSNNLISLDLSTYNKGIYVVEVVQNNEIHTSKIIKQ